MFPRRGPCLAGALRLLRWRHIAALAAVGGDLPPVPLHQCAACLQPALAQVPAPLRPHRFEFLSTKNFECGCDRDSNTDLARRRDLARRAASGPQTDIRRPETAIGNGVRSAVSGQKRTQAETWRGAPHGSSPRARFGSPSSELVRLRGWCPRRAARRAPVGACRSALPRIHPTHDPGPCPGSQVRPAVGSHGYRHASGGFRVALGQ